MPTKPSTTDTMTFSLWSSGELLGHAQLSEETSKPVRAPVLSGRFVPTAGFADVWPAFQAWNRCGSELNARAHTFVTPGVAPEVFREQLLANVPDAVFRALAEAEQAVCALGLELRDEAGQAVPGVSVQVKEWNLFSSIIDDRQALAEAEAEAARQGISLCGYLMVASPRSVKRSSPLL